MACSCECSFCSETRFLYGEIRSFPSANHAKYLTKQSYLGKVALTCGAKWMQSLDLEAAGALEQWLWLSICVNLVFINFVLYSLFVAAGVRDTTDVHGHYSL